MTEEQVFLAALDLPNASARSAYLDEACGEDAQLRGKVQELLAAHFKSGDFMNVPAPVQIDVEPSFNHAVTIQSDVMPAQNYPEPDSDGLSFLELSSRPDSLGRIGHYEVLQVLGVGGFGIVLRAFDDVLQRVVAVKVMAPQLAATSPARKRFLREARSSAQVRHENVVQVYEVGEQPLPYLVMEFIPGETLQQRLDRIGPLDVLEVLRIGRQIAEGLAAAHATDLIHRDIKPGNVLLEGGQLKVKITDFGLARAADDASMTQSGQIVGTPMYMAPEQVLGHTLDQRADLFSLGTVMYQMVSGRAPFRANTSVAVLKRVAEDTPRNIREVIPETPQWLCDIISKLHAKNPDERFQSAREVADLLADCEAQLKQNSRLRDYSRIPRRSSPAPSHAWRWAAAATLLVPIAALAVTELAGVTHLIWQQATRDRVKPGGGPASNAAGKQVLPESEGWVQFFNGKDLSNWGLAPPGSWKIEDGIAVSQKSAGVPTYIWTDGTRFGDVHCRVEFKLGPYSSGSIAVRKQNNSPVFGMYLGNIDNLRQTGSIFLWEPQGKVNIVAASKVDMHTPDAWQVAEVIMRGDQMIVKVDGLETARHSFPKYQKVGMVGLSATGTMMVRKIEIKDLTPAPVAKQSPQPPTFKNSLGMEFVLVPKGKSWLGGGKDMVGNEMEMPADFYLGKYEVTHEEWEQVMGESPSWFSRTGKGKDAVMDISDADLKRFPVEDVTWDQCQIFVAKLNTLEKASGWVYRLPTNVEWEYACRGGSMADRADSVFDFYFAKPTNTLLPEQANFNKGLDRPCKVGSYEPNRLGLFDMHGNVWEWCDDTEKAANARSQSIHRGGGWRTTAPGATARSRSAARSANTQDIDLGLRLARVPAGTPSPEVKTPQLAVAPFTDADVQRIAALPAAEQVEEVRKELMRRNPGLEGTATHKIEDGVVTELAFIPVKGQDVLTDISPLRALPGLTNLNLWSCVGLEDLEPLRGLRLTRLIIGSLTVSLQVRDLEPLKGMKLTELQLYRCQVQNLEPLKDMPLTRLTLFSHQVGDLGPLKGMPLTVLGLGYCSQIQDFTPLKDLPLTGLHLNDCKVRDLEPFQGMKLAGLQLSGTPVRDLELLKGMPLKHLSIHRTAVTDLRPLQGMELEEIHLTPKNITQGIDILREMKSLKTIGIDYSQSWPPAEFWERYDKGEFTAAPFTDADVERIAALPAAEQVEEVRKELKRLNPGFDGTLTPTIENEVVTELSFNTDQVDNIAPVRALKGLIYLDCRGTYPNKGKLSDLSPLTGMTLSRLDCSSTQVADLTPLADLPLTFLHFNHNPVSDLTPLKGMPLLELGCAETKVSDLSPLMGMKLRKLGAQLLPVTDLSPLAGMPLTGLDLYHTIGVTSLEPLKGMPLEGLNLQDVPVSDLSPLAGMTTLRTLLLQGCNVSDLSPLAGLNLTDLFLRDKQITDLSPLKGLPLTRLSINGSGVSDLTPLQGMPLAEIRLNPKNITEGLDILRDIKSLKTIGIDDNKAWPAAEFWDRYDDGEFTNPPSATNP